jgi:hypothetical protein
MLFAMAALLFTLWVLGLGSGAALGVWVHLLLALALVSLAFAGVGARARAPRLRTVPVRDEAPPAAIPRAFHGHD